mmetsp:Transcript_136824/g.251032  ORF Transcript_136824/g.251032 Transcript_136824/m.251032 type:complete len:113 (+) Transcript_136824:1363-1701(+)
MPHVLGSCTPWLFQEEGDRQGSGLQVILVTMACDGPSTIFSSKQEHGQQDFELPDFVAAALSDLGLHSQRLRASRSQVSPKPLLPLLPELCHVALLQGQSHPWKLHCLNSLH